MKVWVCRHLVQNTICNIQNFRKGPRYSALSLTWTNCILKISGKPPPHTNYHMFQDQLLDPPSLKVSPWLKKILNFDGPISPRMKDFNNFFTEYLLHNSRKSNRSKKVRKRSTTERKEHKGAYFSVISKKVRKGRKGASLGPLLAC